MLQVHSESLECKVSAQRMWHGLFKDGHNCLPKAMPHHVLSVEYPHGQIGFHQPGHERLIKLRKALSDEGKEAEKHVEKEEAVVKKEAEKVGKEVKEKTEELVGGAEKEGEEAKKKAQGVVAKAVGGVQKVGGQVKETVVGVGEGVIKKAKEVVGGAEKVGEEVKEKAKEEAKKVEKVGGEVKWKAEEEAKEVEKEAHKLEEEVKEVGKEAHKVEEKEGEALHKEGEKVGEFLHHGEKEAEGALHKLGEFLHHEELWIHEKIEEVDHELMKITVRVAGGAFIGSLLKHCSHTFHLNHHFSLAGAGSLLHWTSHFDTLPLSAFHPSYLDKLKLHALAPFHAVEEYLLKHDDYIAHK
ncbi:hypothetical protein L7F22_066321 [Adiantum nelumboides]|nr:hypothetical protein [Adiantum nelumboides]